MTSFLIFVTNNNCLGTRGNFKHKQSIIKRILSHRQPSMSNSTYCSYTLVGDLQGFSIEGGAVSSRPYNSLMNDLRPKGSTELFIKIQKVILEHSPLVETIDLQICSGVCARISLYKVLTLALPSIKDRVTDPKSVMIYYCNTILNSKQLPK